MGAGHGWRSASARTCFALQRPRLHNCILLLEAVAGCPVPEPQAAIVGTCRRGKAERCRWAREPRCGGASKLTLVNRQLLHSPLAITPSWLTAMQFTMACRGWFVLLSVQPLAMAKGWGVRSRLGERQAGRPPSLTRCCCRKLCRKSPCGSLNFFRLSAAPVHRSEGGKSGRRAVRHLLAGWQGASADCPHHPQCCMAMAPRTNRTQRCARWARPPAPSQPAERGGAMRLHAQQGAANVACLRRLLPDEPQACPVAHWPTFLWCVRVASVLPMRRSHSRTVLSWLAVITCSGGAPICT